jgi:hypothetical protein
MLSFLHLIHSENVLKHFYPDFSVYEHEKINFFFSFVIQ